MTRISRAFAAAREAQRAAFIPYLTAGFPTTDDFLEHARQLLGVGDLLEVGLPFSDPLGDGPTIQRSSERALAGGTTVAKVFSWIAALRSQSDKPLLLMTYYNPIYCYAGGEEGFLEDFKEVGGDGIILPDLPPDEATTLLPVARRLELDTVFLVAPTSTRERLQRVTSACRGFVYAVSVTGVTGARKRLPESVSELVRRTRAVSELPIAVGFGVSNAATARPLASIADGVVVGSALIRAIDEGRGVGELAREIAGACRRTGINR